MATVEITATTTVAACAVVVFGFSGLVRAQDYLEDAEAIAPVERLSHNELPGRLRTYPRDAFRTDPAVGVTHRELFRNSHDPFRPRLDTPDPGVEFRSDTADANLRLGIPDFSVRLRVLRGFAPERAHLKAGPVYFKLDALSAGILASDNPTFSQDDPDADAIAIVRLSGRVMAQVTESLRIAAGGSLFWLPLEGKFGFGSGSLLEQLAFSDRDMARAQISWDPRIAEWDVYVGDTLRVYPDYSGWRGFEDVVLFEGEAFEESDRMGRYAFGGGRYARSQAQRDMFDTFDIDGYVVSNEIVGVAERLLPGPIRLRIRAYHEDLWYNQGTRGSPRLREGASVLLRSERENLRFNPFARYDIFRASFNPELSQSIIFGLQGPITDQLQVSLYGGSYLGGGRNESRALGGMHLTHLAGPYTTESLFVGREIDEYINQTVDSVRFQLRQVLGPRLDLSAYVFYSVATALEDSAFQTEFYGTGLRLDWGLGPRTHLSIMGLYRKEMSESSRFLFSDRDERDGTAEYNQKVLRLQLSYAFTRTFDGQITYRFLDRDSTQRRGTFEENLVYLSFTKYFE